jgi:hypothetical protein
MVLYTLLFKEGVISSTNMLISIFRRYFAFCSFAFFSRKSTKRL